MISKKYVNKDLARNDFTKVLSKIKEQTNCHFRKWGLCINFSFSNTYVQSFEIRIFF